MRKLSKKLLLSILSVALVFIALGTTTFAWFSLNSEVPVTGMTVNTKVSNYLLIADDTLANAAKKQDNLFTTSLTQTSTSTLLPVSTVNGKNFFYTLNALANGDSAEDGEDAYEVYNAEEVPSPSELTSFMEAYGLNTAAVGYVDYVFQLKAVNADTSNAHDVKITKLDLFYAVPASHKSDLAKAFRVAVFAQDITSTNPTANQSGTLKGIFAETDAANHTENSAIGSKDATAPATISTTAYNTVASIGTVAAGQTAYFKVVIRLYLEGEDTTCKNDTYAELTSNWSLNINIAIETTGTLNQVTKLSKYNVATVSSAEYFYDGTYVWNNKANIGTETGRTAKASADSAVKTAFGITD